MSEVEKTGIGAAVVAILLCLPCLLVALGTAGGVAVGFGAAAWMANNSVIAVAGVAAAVALAAGIIAYRRRRPTSCESRPSTLRTKR